MNQHQHQQTPAKQTSFDEEMATLLSYAQVYVEHYACMNSNRAAKELAARIDALLALDRAICAAPTYPRA